MDYRETKICPMNHDNNSSRVRIRSWLLFRALQHRNYRLFFYGQTLSLVGTWMQQIAMSWLVYRLTGSATLLGVVVFSSQIPNLVIAPVAGVVADRSNKHHVLMWTQSLSMLQAVILSILVIGQVVQVWHLIALSLCIGVINSFDIPARQSFLIDMIERRDDLGNAIALNSSMMNASRLVGPSVAGILIASFGEWICFVVNALSYLAVIVALLAMNVSHIKPKAKGGSIRQELREGLAYAYQFTPIRSILMLIALVSLMGYPYAVLLPVFAKTVLHGGANTYGFLMAAAGLGALTIAIILATRKSIAGLSTVIPIAVALFGTAIIAFSLSRSVAMSIFFLFLAGLGMMGHIASSNTILQALVDDDKRGRVMSLFAMALMGISPLGSLLAGSIADRIGVRYTLLTGGIACLIGALIFASRLDVIRQQIVPTRSQSQEGLLSETTPDPCQ